MRDPEALEQVRTIALTREPDVPGDGEVWEQPVVLRQVADAASLRAEVDPLLGVEPQLASERDPSRVGAFEPGDRA